MTAAATELTIVATGPSGPVGAVSLYGAFIHGATMYGRNVMKAEDIRTRLRSLPQDVELLATIGASGNVVLRVMRGFDENRLRHELEDRLQRLCVVIALPILRAILGELKNSLPPSRRTSHGAHRVERQGLTWEPGVVLASERLPETVSGSAGLFSETSRATALTIAQHRALAVMKRRAPWGNAVIEPWRRVLLDAGIAVGCLTSRSMRSLEATIRAASVAEFSGGLAS